MVSIDLLQSPNTASPLTEEGSFLVSEKGDKFPVADGVPIFVEGAKQETVASHTRKKSFFRSVLKRCNAPHHSIYFNSLKSSHGEGKELKSFLKNHPGLTILNIGSLSMDLKALHPGIINLDISYYSNVDVVGDAHCLPFKDASVDMVLFKNVIEHIRNPDAAMREIWRVLKPGGYLYIKLPFLQPFHAVPDDYQRHSWEGMKELLKEYKELERGIAVGPGSMLSWMLREWLAILTSFGSEKLYKIGILFWGWLTFWVKYTDVFFKGNALSHRVSSAYFGLYQKP